MNLQAQVFFNRLPKDYQALLSDLLGETAFIDLLTSLASQEAQARELETPIFPPHPDVFKALFLTPVRNIRVILIGQDPYHTPGLAHGLAFSIPHEIPMQSKLFPSSLRNINKALILDGFRSLSHGNLSHWANQGVLLLNTCLTVPMGMPHAHRNWGWAQLTDILLNRIAMRLPHLVWLLWGSAAQQKESIANKCQGHLILKASHPSGLGVYQTKTPVLSKGGLIGCGHFKKTNTWLIQQNLDPIRW